MNRVDHALEFLMRDSYNPHRMVWTLALDYRAFEDGDLRMRDVLRLMIGLAQCHVHGWVDVEFDKDRQLWVRLTYAGHQEALRRRAERQN